MKKISFVLLLLFRILAASATTPDEWNRWLGVPLLNPSWSYRLFTGGRFDLPGDDRLRSAYLKETKLCGLTAYELKIHLDGDRMTAIDLVFGNKGDLDRRAGKAVAASRAHLHRELTARCGKPSTQTATMARVKIKMEVWRTPEAVFALEADANEYAVLHIFPPGADPSPGTAKDVRSAIGKTDFSTRVRRNDFGDVFIVVPQIDQGGKGYCVPATYERILRYYGIETISMHQLAALFDSDRDRGTSADKAHKKIAPLFRRVGLSATSQGDIAMTAIKKAIDKGHPLLWYLFADPKYEDIRAANTRSRGGDPNEWKRRKIEKSRCASLPKSETGHLSLIVGYNPLTDEIAVSNTWSSERDGAPTWVPFRVAKKYSQGESFLYAP
ncbi:MAG: C39 family peptidase [Victivallaceae bacterium]|nr:C39 family peptidase [Victivallaceae bacterium]